MFTWMPIEGLSHPPQHFIDRAITIANEGKEKHNVSTTTRRIVRTVLRTKLAMIANFVSTAANAPNPVQVPSHSARLLQATPPNRQGVIPSCLVRHGAKTPFCTKMARVLL